MSLAVLQRNENDVVIGQPDFFTVTSGNGNTHLKSMVQEVAKNGFEASGGVSKAAEDIIKKIHELSPSGRFVRLDGSKRILLASEADSLQYTLIALRKAIATFSLLRLGTEVRSGIATCSKDHIPIQDKEQTSSVSLIKKSSNGNLPVKQDAVRSNLTSILLHNVRDTKSKTSENTSETESRADDSPYSYQTSRDAHIVPDHALSSNNESTISVGNSEKPMMPMTIEKPKFARQVTPPEETVQDQYNETKNSAVASDKKMFKVDNDLLDQLDKVKLARKSCPTPKSNAGIFDAIMLNKNDVLIGLPEHSYYCGNVKFQNYVLSVFRKDDLSRSHSEHALTRIAKLIFYQIRNLTPSGRFLLKEVTSGEMLELQPRFSLLHIINELHKADVATSFLRFPGDISSTRKNKCNGAHQANENMQSTRLVQNVQSPSHLKKRKYEHLHGKRSVEMFSEEYSRTQILDQGKTDYKSKCVKFNPIARVFVIP